MRRFFAITALVLLGSAAHGATNEIVRNEKISTYEDFSRLAREIAKSGEFASIILRDGDSSFRIPIPLLDRHAGMPWYPWILNQSDELVKIKSVQFKRKEGFFYAIVPCSVKEVDGSKELITKIKKEIELNAHEADVCLVLICRPEDSLLKICNLLKESQSLVEGRILFLDARSGVTP